MTECASTYSVRIPDAPSDQWDCSSSVRCGTDENIAWFEKHRARAVAEWLKEQGR